MPGTTPSVIDTSSDQRCLKRVGGSACSSGPLTQYGLIELLGMVAHCRSERSVATRRQSARHFVSD